MLKATFGVLLIGNQPKCLRLLRQQQFEVVCADRLAGGLTQLKTSHVGLVLVALSLPDSRGTEAFVKIHEAVPHLPVIVLATRAQEKLAASLMSLGAQDYLLVPELTDSMLAKAIHNASERYLIHEEHGRAGHLLELLMNNIPDSIYFKDKASQFVMINRGLAKRFGLANPHLAVGKSDADFFAPDYAKQALADEQRVMQTGQPLVGVEEKETWLNGRVTWVSMTKMPLRDRAGRVFGTFGISRDITEHRRIEQVLAERTEDLLKERLLLRTLIDSVPDSIYAKNAAGRKTMANLGDLKNLKCKTEAEVIGKTDFDFFPKEIAEKFQADDQKVLQGQAVINQEEQGLDEKGRKRWLLTSKLPLRDPNGKITGLVGISREITEHKRAEEALANERALLRTLVDNLPVAFYVKDLAGRKTLVNRVELDYVGATSEAEVLGKTDYDLFPPEQAAVYHANDQEIIRTGQSIINREGSLTKPDGSVIHTMGSIVPVRDAAGHVSGVAGITFDITDRKRAEESLRVNKEWLLKRTDELSRERLLLRTLIDNLPDAIYAKDAAGRKTMANPADLKNLRCKTEAEAIGKSDYDFFPPEVAKKFYDDDQKVMHGEPVINREEYFLSDQGEKRWLLTSKLPLRSKSGEITGLIGIGRDITEHKLAEDKLAYEQALFQTLLDNLPDSIYFKDRESRFVRVSRSKVERSLAVVRNRYLAAHPDASPKEMPDYLKGLEQFAGYMPGKTDFDFYSEERARPAYEDEQTIIRTGQPSIGKLEHAVQPDGKIIWLIATKMPWRDKDGNIIGTFGVSHDITALKEAEEKLAKYTRQLEEKDHQTAEELKMARELQLAMLPHEFPCVPRHKPRGEGDLEFFSLFFPAGAVSGDFFDVIPLSDTAVGLFICDVMGHDVRAALVTAMMRALVAELSGTTTEPGEMLAQINREVAGVFKQTGSTMYATAFYLIADVARAELRYASAAHPEPILLHRQLGTAEWLGNGPGRKKGPALGLFAEGQFPTYRCSMEVGDLIALFTDGLIEAEGADHESFSAERLLAAVRQRANLPANELFAGLLDEIKHFSASSEFEDDVCVVGVEVKRLEAQQPNWMV